MHTFSYGFIPFYFPVSVCEQVFVIRTKLPGCVILLIVCFLYELFYAAQDQLVSIVPYSLIYTLKGVVVLYLQLMINCF